MPPAVEVEPEQGHASWRTRFILIALAAVLFAVLGATGGLDRAAPPPAPSLTAAVDQKIDAGPWNVTVTDATATDDLEPFKPRTEGNWLIAIVVTLETNAPDAQPGYRFQDAIELPEMTGLADKTPRYTLLLRDASNLAFINPGLPERVAFIYEVAQATPVPKQVMVRVNGMTPYKSWITRTYMWSDPGERARVTVDVVNKLGIKLGAS